MTSIPEPPPAAAAYYPPPAYASAPPKDLTAFGVLAFAAATLYTVFAVVDAAVSGRAIRHVDDTGALDWSVPVYFLVTVFEVLALLAGWVLGSMWLHRARKNAEALAPGAHHARSAGWAWGGWVCPIVSFWFPFQVVRDVHRAVSPTSTSSLTGWWWALYLVMTLGTNIMGNATADATASDASAVQSANVFFAVVSVAALVLWGLVLRRTTREQHARMLGGQAFAG